MKFRRNGGRLAIYGEAVKMYGSGRGGGPDGENPRGRFGQTAERRRKPRRSAPGGGGGGDPPRHPPARAGRTPSLGLVALGRDLGTQDDIAWAGTTTVEKEFYPWFSRLVGSWRWG